MSEDVLMMVAVMAGAVMIAGHMARVIRTNLLQQTIREAILRESALTGDLLDRLDRLQPSESSDDRTGLVLVAIGAALLCYGLIQGRAEDIRELSGVALFPIFVGAVLLGRHYFTRRSAGER